MSNFRITSESWTLNAIKLPFGLPECTIEPFLLCLIRSRIAVLIDFAKLEIVTQRNLNATLMAIEIVSMEPHAYQTSSWIGAVLDGEQLMVEKDLSVREKEKLLNQFSLVFSCCED